MKRYLAIGLVSVVFCGCAFKHGSALTSQEIENGRAEAFIGHVVASDDFKSYAPSQGSENGDENQTPDNVVPESVPQPSVGIPAPVNPPVVRQPQKCLMYYTAKWCVPCRKMQPMLRKAAAQAGVKVADYGSTEKGAGVWIVDGDVVKSKRNITAYPTVIYLEDGVEVQRWVGLQTLDTVYQMLDLVRR